MANKRISWIDVAKGIAMLCVIVGHTASRPIENEIKEK